MEQNKLFKSDSEEWNQSEISEKSSYQSNVVVVLNLYKSKIINFQSVALT